MTHVGERLRLLRESRNTTLEEMVTATGIGQSYLEALERDAIPELPGKAFGKLYIRAYAEVFTFDPQPWIDDYDREQRLVAGASTEPTSPAPTGSRPVAAAIAQWKAARAAADRPEPAIEEVEVVADVATIEPEPAAPPEEPAVPPAVSPNAKRRLAPVVVVGVVAIAAAIYFGMRKTEVAGNGEQPPVRTVQPVPESLPPEPPPPEPPPPVVVKTPAPVPLRAPGLLSVTEFGVGRRVVNLNLEGESDHFDEGARVYFSTRVAGSQRGEVIRHVWLYEGRVQQTITLRIGGPDWRTHSNKTLGRAGAWAVEARDDKGRVLARMELTCGPAGP
jgi:hypothetical protein